MTGAPALLCPADAREAVEAVREAAAAGRSLCPVGRRSRIARHRRGLEPETWLSLAGLDGILEVDAAEQVCVAGAGVVPKQLDASLAEHGLELAVRAPGAAAGTLGGLFLAPDHSLLEGTWGPPRDQVLGAEWLLADGSRVRSGGRVVKNVAGYDLTRLFLGSGGRLAACLTLTLRLRPRPRQPRWFRLTPEGLAAWLSAAPAKRTAARLLFRAPGGGDWLQTDGISPPPELDAAEAGAGAGEAACAACLEAFSGAPGRARIRLGRRRILAGSAPPDLAVDWLAGVAAATPGHPALAGLEPRRVPSLTPSPWLARLQEACAPGAPPFGGSPAPGGPR